MSKIPKNLFKDGFAEKGEPIEIGSLEDIRDFIKNNLSQQKTINTQTSSYGLKHIIENKLQRKYVSNGELIASMILEGYEYKIDKKNHLNAYFNLSKETIKRLL